MQFSRSITDKTETYNFSPQEIESADIGDMLLFSFCLKSPSAALVDITVDVGTDISCRKGFEKTVRYTVPSQLSKIYVPVINNGIKNISISVAGSITVYESLYENLGNVTHEQIQQKSGMWLMEDFEYRTVRDDERLNVGKTTDLVINNGYIYSIGDGKLTVTDVHSRKVMSVIDCFSVMRQIDITKDGRYVVVTGRQNDVAIISVKNATAPYIAASYNSIEFATGLHISGNYAFVCNRQYGVEVVDISNPEKPRHLANIRSGEVQSCTVHNNILYAGVWGECGVYMYDLARPAETPYIQPVGFVKTNGKGDGITVVDMGDRTYMFAATGHSRTDCTTVESPLSNLWHGQGNGMDIFDVTNPADAYWVSGVHTDGRFYHFANDYWNTDVRYDEVNDKYYAYLVNTYNGVFVYDVTNPAAPKRLMQISVPLPVCDGNPPLAHNVRHTVTPWNQQTERRSPVGAVAVCAGCIYIAATQADLYCVQCEYAFDRKKTSQNTDAVNFDEGFYDFKNLSTDRDGVLPDSYLLCGYDGICQAYAVAAHGDLLYVASGLGGVKIYDKITLEQKVAIPSATFGGLSGFAYDVAVWGDMLYVAEGAGGLSVYDISGNVSTAPQFLWRYIEPCESVRQVVISPEGRFAVIHYGSNNVKVIDVAHSSHRVVLETTAGNYMMYHRQICRVIYDRYICFWSHNGIEYCLDFGSAANRFDTPVLVEPTFNDTLGGCGMTNGPCEIVDDKGKHYILKITADNRFCLADSIAASPFAFADGARERGIPVMCGDCVAVCNRITGSVDVYRVAGSVDRGDICFDALASYVFAGNPDRAFADGNRLYIPLGYQGVGVFSL